MMSSTLDLYDAIDQVNAQIELMKQAMDTLRIRNEYGYTEEQAEATHMAVAVALNGRTAPFVPWTRCQLCHSRQDPEQSKWKGQTRQEQGTALPIYEVMAEGIDE